jgi:hydrogenase/urease accessory protein HupE
LRQQAKVGEVLQTMQRSSLLGSVIAGCLLAAAIYGFCWQTTGVVVPLWWVLPLVGWLSLGIHLTVRYVQNIPAVLALVALFAVPVVYVSSLIHGSTTASWLAVIWLLGVFVARFLLSTNSAGS